MHFWRAGNAASHLCTESSPSVAASDPNQGWDRLAILDGKAVTVIFCGQGMAESN